MMDKIYNSDESDDGDIFPNKNQTQIQSIRIQGPNISNFNISKLHIGNNGRPRYAESLYDQRSYIRERRDTSPMSVHSTMSLHHQKFQHSMYNGAMSSQRSMYNGKFGSSMSVRSFDSNVTLSAIDIAQAFKTENFNERDKRIIEAAFNKYMKKHSLKRIKKRRKKRLSSYDSGEQGGESSGSSDDARSVRTCRTTFPDNNSNSSCKSARTDCTAFRRTIQRTNLYKDCTENFKQNAFRSLISSAPKYGGQKINHQKQSIVLQRTEHYPLMVQKERFANGFLLPSQKFNQSTASLIPEHQYKQNIVERCSDRNNLNHAGNHHLESGSESEEIFSVNTTVEKNITKPNCFQSKRNLNHSDDENSCLPQKKRNKLSSPQKRIDTNKRSQKQNQTKTDSKTCDFIFAKPQLPLRKPVIVKKTLKPIQSNNSKQNDESSQAVKKSVSESNQRPAKELSTKTSNAVEEKAISKYNSPPRIIISPEPQPAEQLIAMSSQPLDDVMVSNPMQMVKNLPSNSSQDKDHIDQSECTQLSTTDMSMRPSFIKRKLFTQKADIADNKNASSDSIEENSSQSNMYSMIQKEKNRTRKLVTSQSCLNRDLGDESNLLDLIHKIVPANQMNLTSATNRTDIRSNKSKPENGPGDKWDVSLAITKCNKDEESDTYTDEEIFNTNETVNKSKATKTNTARTEKEKPKKIANKLKPPITQVKPPEEKQKAHESRALSCVKSFWSSDEENEARTAKIPEKTKKDALSNNGNKLDQVSSIAKTVKEKPKQVANKLKSPIAQVKPPEENRDIHKIRALKCINSFWHSDVESDEETAKNSETTITSNIKRNDHKLELVSAAEELSTKNKTCMFDAEKHTKATNGENKTITTSASRNFNQKKSSKDKSLSKSPPQKKQVQTTKGKLGKSQKSVSKEIVKDIAVKKSQEKVKANKNVTSNVNTEKLNDTKVAHSNREAAFTQEKDVYQKVVNKTLRIRLCPKLKCCDESPKNIAVNEKTKLLSKSLRNREVDLSTTASSGLDTPLKDVPKRRGRPRKIERNTKTVENKENISNLSDLSFTLQLDRTIMTRRMKSKLGVLSDNRKRPSDVSFSLVTDCKNFNKTGVTTRSADQSRNESNTIVVEVTKQKRMLIKSPLKINTKTKCRSK